MQEINEIFIKIRCSFEKKEHEWYVLDVPSQIYLPVCGF